MEQKQRIRAIFDALLFAFLVGMLVSQILQSVVGEHSILQARSRRMYITQQIQHNDALRERGAYLLSVTQQLQDSTDRFIDEAAALGYTVPNRTSPSPSPQVLAQQLNAPLVEDTRIAEYHPSLLSIQITTIRIIGLITMLVIFGFTMLILRPE